MHHLTYVVGEIECVIYHTLLTSVVGEIECVINHTLLIYVVGEIENVVIYHASLIYTFLHFRTIVIETRPADELTTPSNIYILVSEDTPAA